MSELGNVFASDCTPVSEILLPVKTKESLKNARTEVDMGRRRASKKRRDRRYILLRSNIVSELGNAFTSDSALSHPVS